MGEGGQNILFSAPSMELVLRSIGGREGERKRKGTRSMLGPKTDNMLQQPHRHRWLYHPHCHAQKDGHKHRHSTGLL